MAGLKIWVDIGGNVENMDLCFCIFTQWRGVMKKYIELETVGTVLKEEFIEPHKLTVEQVAKAISVPAWRLFAVIDGGEPMAADLDLLLTKYFGLTEGYFLRMQELYNLRLAKQKLRKKLSNVIPVFKLPKKVVAAL